MRLASLRPHGQTLDHFFPGFIERIAHDPWDEWSAQLRTAASFDDVARCRELLRKGADMMAVHDESNGGAEMGTAPADRAVAARQCFAWLELFMFKGGDRFPARVRSSRR